MGETSPAVTATITSSSRATPSVTFPEPDQRSALSLPREENEVLLAETLGNLRGLPEHCVGLLDLALVDGAVGEREEEIAPLHAVVPTVVEQAPSTRQPATGLSGFSLEHEGKRHPERTTSGPNRIARGQIFVVSASHDLGAVGIPAYEMRGGRQTLQVFRGKRSLPIRHRQGREGLVPILAVEGFAAAITRVRPRRRSTHRRSPSLFARIPLLQV